MLITSFVSRFRRLLRLQALCGGVLVLALCSMPIQAGVVTIVLSADSAPYQEASEAIESRLKLQHTVIQVLADKIAISGSALARANLIVSVGVRAADLIAAQGGTTPVLAVLVTEDWYQGQGRAKLTAGGRSTGAIVLEQPFSRQLRLVKNAFPDAYKVGVVVGRKNAALLESLRAAAEAEGLTLVGAVADSESSLVTVLGQVLKDSDLLLAVPDADVLNRNTVQSVLMTSYRYRDPVVGYSKALSRAGALLSLYSSPEQIGRQAGELAEKSLNGAKLPVQQWPKYYSISVNEHVARSLGVDTLSEAALLSRMGGDND